MKITNFSANDILCLEMARAYKLPELSPADLIKEAQKKIETEAKKINKAFKDLVNPFVEIAGDFIKISHKTGEYKLIKDYAPYLDLCKGLISQEAQTGYKIDQHLSVAIKEASKFIDSDFWHVDFNNVYLKFNDKTVEVIASNRFICYRNEVPNFSGFDGLHKLEDIKASFIDFKFYAFGAYHFVPQVNNIFNRSGGQVYSIRNKELKNIVQICKAGANKTFPKLKINNGKAFCEEPAYGLYSECKIDLPFKLAFNIKEMAKILNVCKDDILTVDYLNENSPLIINGKYALMPCKFEDK